MPVSPPSPAHITEPGLRHIPRRARAMCLLSGDGEDLVGRRLHDLVHGASGDGDRLSYYLPAFAGTIEPPKSPPAEFATAGQEMVLVPKTMKEWRALHFVRPEGAGWRRKHRLQVDTDRRTVFVIRIEGLVVGNNFRISKQMIEFFVTAFGGPKPFGEHVRERHCYTVNASSSARIAISSCVSSGSFVVIFCSSSPGNVTIRSRLLGCFAE